jgi:DNA polymerase
LEIVRQFPDEFKIVGLTTNKNSELLLKQIKDEVVDLKESPLYQERVKTRMLPVIGEGSHYAEIMFVGEAPGKTEAATGRPFAGAAGRVLDELLKSIGIDRKDVYITNVVKDRPPNNRDPLPEEVALYAPFLDRQIGIIKPKIVVALGRHSMKYLLGNFGISSGAESISKIHGMVYEVQRSYGKIKFMPTFHPATVLYNPETKKHLQADFEALAKLMEES